jgi:uncharacterized protein (TIGR03083 family)
MIETAHLFATLDGKLLDLLRSLSPSEWDMRTVAPQWTVRDVAAHLLDTSLRRLSLGRDGFFTESPDGDLVAFINRLNQRGVETYGRLSPAVLISLMEVATVELARYLQSLDPMGRALFPVSWAGEAESFQWFDTAREYTERWHHQQQIRLAVGRPGIESRELYHPVLDCFLRALPYCYRDVDAADGSCVVVEIVGESGGVWGLRRSDGSWQLDSNTDGADARVSIPQEIAWRIFTKGIARREAEARVRFEGELGRHVLALLAIVG